MSRLSPITAAHEFFQGRTKRFVFTVYDRNGQPVNINGANLRWTMHPVGAQHGAPALIAKTTGAGITILDGPSGQALLEVDEADTLSTGITPKDFYHWFDDVDTGENLAYGPCTLLPAP